MYEREVANQRVRSEYQTFSFEGTGAEYFRIWIVNIALTILTLGIYSAWAKVRTNRYIYANTYLNGSNFEYNADPIKILIGRVIVVGVYGAFVIFSEYLMMLEVAGFIALMAVVLMPWLMRQAVSFKLRNTSYRNIPFKYRGKTGDFYLFFILHGLLNIVTLFLALPYSYAKFKKLIISQSEYGQGKFSFDGTAGESYSTYILVFVWSTITIMGLFLFIAMIIGIIVGAGGMLSNDDINALGETAQMASVLSDVNSTILIDNNITYDNNISYSDEEMDEAMGVIGFLGLLLMFIIYLPIMFWQKGFSDGYFSNFVRNFSRLEDAPLKGTMSPFKLGVISATNVIMIILSLGLLYPWAKIRYLRYKLENTHFRCADYEQFESLGYEKGSTVGEEMVDFFDIDVGL
jgi:uncharacterized membrane protein YjgN (DUF898 family)